MTSMFYDFETKTHGKWILSGEHAVLRDHPAIVFPIKSKTLSLTYQATDESLRAEFSGSSSDSVHLLFWGVLEHGLALINKNISDMHGKLLIDNDIPFGAGVGGSAALCAAIARWLHAQKLIPMTVHEFARQLENLFHNESSGVDIVGALADEGYIYQRNGDTSPLNMQWQPHWYLSYSEQIGMTSMCVKKVKALAQTNVTLANHIDNNMKDATESCISALRDDPRTGLIKLTAAINQARVCFTQWGLTGGKVDHHINDLLEKGALAAKPTGSGDGGYILSLWSAPPENHILKDLITLSG